MVTGNQKFSPDFSKELDIEALISAPLVAASKANAVMSTGQTRFLLEYCFTKGENNVYAPVMIEMSMTKGIVDGTKEAGDSDHVKLTQLTFSIPLLCIVPINSLVVDKVRIDFHMDITSATPKETQHANGTDNKVTERHAKLNGKIGSAPDQEPGSRGSKQSSRHKSNQLKVSLNASPLPLTSGLLKILDIYAKAIQPTAVATPDRPGNNPSSLSNKS